MKESFTIYDVGVTSESPDITYFDQINSIFPRFDGRIRVAATLLRSFISSADEVANIFEQMGLRKYIPPSVGLCASNSRVNTFGHYDGSLEGNPNYILVTGLALDHFSRYDPDIVFEHKSQGQLEFIGTPREMFMISAVEECFHGLCSDYGLFKDLTETPRSMVSYPEYVSRPDEKLGFRVKYKYAKYKKMSPQLIKFLEDHL